MADQKIELEIVLDDGSIKKAFATIRRESELSAKESAKVFQEEFAKADFIKKAFDKQNIGNALKNILRAEDFAKSAKESASVFSEEFAKNTKLNLFNPEFLTGSAAGIYIFEKVAASVKNVTDKIVEMSRVAENARVTHAQFAQFTEQTGIATEQFSKQILSAVGGLLDDDEALKLANDSMIRLGVTAQRLPQIIQLASKISATGLTDLKSAIEILVSAIQTGNVKQLQGIGITLDLNKAHKEYADTLGISAEKLNKQQESFVNANKIIDEASKKFGVVDSNVRSFSDSITKLNVAISQDGQRTAEWFDRIFGATTKGIIDGLTSAISGNGAALAAEKVKVEDLGKAIEDAQKKLLTIQDNLSRARTDTQFSYLNNQLNETNRLLDALKARQASTQNFAVLGNANDLLSKNIKLSWEKAQADKSNAELAKSQYDAELLRQQQLQQSMAAFQQQEIAARQQRLQYIVDDQKRQQEAAAIHEEQLRLIVDNGIKARQQIETQYSNEKGFTKAQRDALELEQIESQNQQVLASQEAFQNQSLDSFQKYSIEQQKKFQQLGSMVKITFINGIGGAFVAFGQALAKGENAMEAFGRAMLGVLGDIAIQMGQMFIWQGLGFSANPLMPGSGAGLVAAGIGLSILGGVLKGLAGGGSAGNSAGAGGGVATGGVETGGFNAAAPIDNTRIAPNTVINFTVQGDILDSDSTQSRIVQLLNDAIDTKGAVVRGL